MKKNILNKLIIVLGLIAVESIWGAVTLRKRSRTVDNANTTPSHVKNQKDRIKIAEMPQLEAQNPRSSRIDLMEIKQEIPANKKQKTNQLLKIVEDGISGKNTQELPVNGVQPTRAKKSKKSTNQEDETSLLKELPFYNEEPKAHFAKPPIKKFLSTSRTTGRISKRTNISKNKRSNSVTADKTVKPTSIQETKKALKTVIKDIKESGLPLSSAKEARVIDVVAQHVSPEKVAKLTEKATALTTAPATSGSIKDSINTTNALNNTLAMSEVAKAVLRLDHPLRASIVKNEAQLAPLRDNLSLNLVRIPASTDLQFINGRPSSFSLLPSPRPTKQKRNLTPDILAEESSSSIHTQNRKPLTTQPQVDKPSSHDQVENHTKISTTLAQEAEKTAATTTKLKKIQAALANNAGKIAIGAIVVGAIVTTLVDLLTGDTEE